MHEGAVTEGSVELAAASCVTKTPPCFSQSSKPRWGPSQSLLLSPASLLLASLIFCIVLEECRGEVGVVVLSGVDYPRGNAEEPDDVPEFHDLRAGA